ncbi:hypothetical protein [Marinimicrobium sp. ABcell2]|uniref:hypothetical protein n=1 Tax=Marinimicrobium sp. ABcell2 TaxID=3069751 RepID=UPI0027B5930F|nr:hypothetical protein [Marinimicrobium sp. ABcell2]MDQ2076190.1 hypothetical protein [Marinimicrobium sp. ABcell2]
MKHVLLNHRRLLTAAVLSSAVVLSACGGAEGANSLLDQKRPTSPWSETSPDAPETEAPIGVGSEAPVGSEPGLPQDTDGGNDTTDPDQPDSSDSTDPTEPVDAGTDPDNNHSEPEQPPTAGGSSEEEPEVPAEPPEADVNVVLMWSPPTERENGDYLEDTELGGYEIRFRKSIDEDYEVIRIEDGYTTEYEFLELDGEFEFEIAAYDTSGLYSVFVAIEPL